MAPSASARKLPPGQKKETSVDKKKRIANNRKAKQIAQSYIIPALIAILLAVVVTFFYLYGFGGVAKKIPAKK